MRRILTKLRGTFADTDSIALGSRDPEDGRSRNVLWLEMIARQITDAEKAAGVIL